VPIVDKSRGWEGQVNFCKIYADTIHGQTMCVATNPEFQNLEKALVIVGFEAETGCSQRPAYN